MTKLRLIKLLLILVWSAVAVLLSGVAWFVFLGIVALINVLRPV